MEQQPAGKGRPRRGGPVAEDQHRRPAAHHREPLGGQGPFGAGGAIGFGSSSSPRSSAARGRNRSSRPPGRRPGTGRNRRPRRPPVTLEYRPANANPTG